MLKTKPLQIFQATLVVFSLIATSAFSETSRPNVLFILSDDLRPELSCYSSKVATPNLDRLAARGVRFANAWVQYPLCNPSRTSMLTGRHPTTTGALTNRNHFRHSYPDMVTLPQFFKNSGYQTLKIGKVFHDSADDSPSWSHGAKKPPTAPTPNSAPAPAAVKPYDPKFHREFSDRIEILEGNGENHGDYKNADQAISKLREYAASKEPFFMTCGFSKPHSPPQAPQKWFDATPLEAISLPLDFKPTADPGPEFPAASLSNNGDLFIGRNADEDSAKKMIQAYHASVKWMDWNAGRVLDALQESGLDKNTIVVFWGDHGYHLGEKGKWSKHNSLFNIGLRVPMILAGPGVANGETSQRVVQSLDLFPTLLELCSLPIPSGLDGRSLVPLLNKPSAEWPHPAYAVTYNGKKLHRAVRDERFLYAEFDAGKAGAMLIDLKNDPHELVNCLEKPEFQEDLSRMKQLLSFLPTEAKVLPEY